MKTLCKRPLPFYTLKSYDHRQAGRFCCRFFNIARYTGIAACGGHAPCPGYIVWRLSLGSHQKRRGRQPGGCVERLCRFWRGPDKSRFCAAKPAGAAIRVDGCAADFLSAARPSFYRKWPAGLSLFWDSLRFAKMSDLLPLQNRKSPKAWAKLHFMKH